MSPVYYFGVYDRQLGHFLRRPGTGYEATYRVDDELRAAGCPWPTWHFDGNLCPDSTYDARNERFTHPDRQVEGDAALHHRDGWTALSFWDRSMDRRGNCSSTFAAPGTHTFEQMKALAEQHFPEVWERFKFQVVVR